MLEDKGGIELDKQDTDEVFRQLEMMHEELTQVKNLLTELLVHQSDTLKKAA
jgi:hypothetical protein